MQTFEDEMLMGAQPPRELMLQLRQAFDIDAFVESGTYLGQTTFWASRHFQFVITIECSPELYAELAPQHAAHRNVQFRQGNSRQEMGEIVRRLEGPALFWLDGHWSGGLTYGENDECPLLDELSAISKSEHEHFVFVDDVRYFLMPPPSPHDRHAWPELQDVFQAVNGFPNRPYTIIQDDVLICVPRRAEELVANWSLQRGLQAQDDAKEKGWWTHWMQKIAGRP